MNLINRIFGKTKKVDNIKQNVIKGRKSNVRDLRKLNKTMKFLIQEGQVEITVKNIKGVIKEVWFIFGHYSP